MSCVCDFIEAIEPVMRSLFLISGIIYLLNGVSKIHFGMNHYDKINPGSNAPAIAFTLIGVIMVVIAFFGYRTAVRKNDCMVVTYAFFVLTMWLIQIAIGIWTLGISKNVKLVDSTEEYRKNIFNNYWINETDREIVDTLQSHLKCCGVTSSNDFNQIVSQNATIPWTCCGNEENESCTSHIYEVGCSKKLLEHFTTKFKRIGGISIAFGAIPLMVITISALCAAISFTRYGTYKRINVLLHRVKSPVYLSQLV